MRDLFRKIKLLLFSLYEETFEQWGCDGETVTGEHFHYVHPKYIRVSGLNCSAPDWIYIDFKSHGYIKDGTNYYPLQNVAHIKWFLVSTRTEEVFYQKAKITYTTQEIDREVRK